MTTTLKELLGEERIQEYIGLDILIRSSLYFSEKDRYPFVEALYEEYGPHTHSDIEVMRGYVKKGHMYVTLKKDGVEGDYLVGEVPHRLLKSPYVQKPFDLENVAFMRRLTKLTS